MQRAIRIAVRAIIDYLIGSDFKYAFTPSVADSGAASFRRGRPQRRRPPRICSCPSGPRRSSATPPTRPLTRGARPQRRQRPRSHHNRVKAQLQNRSTPMSRDRHSRVTVKSPSPRSRVAARSHHLHKNHIRASISRPRQIRRLRRKRSRPGLVDE